MSCFSCLFRGRDEELSGVHNVNLFTYEELRIATDEFNPINKVGEGGFGSVYKGTLKNGKIAAIKVLSAQLKLGAGKFLTEIKVIADIEHENLVKLYGCCAEGIIEFWSTTTLRITVLLKHLSLAGGGHSSMQFSWRTRTRICIGVARGLAFLHEEVQPHIVHRDIKASNILLDKDLTPKISDFGLAKLIPNMTHVNTRMAGTLGYLAPEYAIRGLLTRKADIYSFGVLLMETVSGRCNTNPRLLIEEQYLLERTWDLYERRELVGLVDTSLNGEFDAEQACRFLKIGLLCTQDSPRLRPSMSTVVKMLMGEIDIDGKEIKKPALISDFMDLKIKTPTNSKPHKINSSYNDRRSSGFRTPDKQNLSTPDPNSRGEEDLEPLQLQMHQYSDAPFSISNRGSTSGIAPEGGVLYMEELVRLNEMGEVATKGQKLSLEVSHSSEEDFLEEMWSEELEETPSDPRELEDLNCNPMEVPPTISHHFSIHHVLDLSYTEINSLPQSISRLVALQKLFLRSCELLMELPPEIGELSNLQVLDLEGTEILSLPKEIAKLVNLTCLKVSFYGYANKTVIPRRVLANLSRLNELIIDVTPYGEWWDVEVEDIKDDLFSLDELRTLKLYLPTDKLLEGLTKIFSRLANFRFTVGRHEEHFISRLPRDVEGEFNNQEKLEKGLKYINGNRIPNEITKVFKRANSFFLQRHWTAKSLSEFGHENMNEVKFCLVMECNEFRTIIDSGQYHQGKDGGSESEDFLDFDETIILGSLQKMIIRYMKNMVSIWKGPVGKGSLSNLKYLSLHTCPNLTTLFTFGMLSNLINLEELIVEDCPKIDSLVSLKSSNSKSGLFLPNLKKISLLELPELVSISNGLGIAPKLERMVIFYCPKLEKLSTMDVSSTNLKVIKGEKEWWDALKWYESDVSTEHEDYLARLFIPLRRDGDLMAQLTKD